VRAVLVATVLAVFAIVAMASMARKSITTDEVPHITAGYSYWKTADFRVNPEHPPLAKLLAGIPLFFVDPVFDTRHPSWSRARIDQGFEFAFRFILDTPPNVRPDNVRPERHREILFWARTPIVVMGMVLCLYLYLLARLLFGNTAALLTLVLTAFSPTILAHSRVVTTDVTLTAFWVGATYHLIRFLRDHRWSQLIYCGLTTGLAMGAKFSGIFTLLTTGYVCAVSLFMRGGPWSAPEGQDSMNRLGHRAIQFGLQMVAYAAVAFVVVVFLYFVNEFPRYFGGFQKVFANHDPRYRAFYFGGHYSGIIWTYYVGALLVKLPLGTMALAAIGFIFLRRDGAPLTWKERGILALVGLWPVSLLVPYLVISGRLPIQVSALGVLLLLALFAGATVPICVLMAKHVSLRREWVERLALVTPALVIFAISTLSGKYLGIRYVLPCLPLLLLLAGRTLTLAWAARFPGRLVPLALAATVVVSSLANFPDYISYFNEAAGGPRGGASLLDDSNIDWGQDWLQLAEYQQNKIEEEARREPGLPAAQSVRNLGFWPHNRIDPRRPYGIQGYEISEKELYWPRAGWYAVGAHTMNRDYIYSYERPISYDWLERYEPVDRVGGAIYVFRFWHQTPDHPPPRGFKGTVLTPERLFADARERLDKAKQTRPDACGIYFRLAQLFVDHGNPEEARENLRAGAEAAEQSSKKALEQLHADIDLGALRRMTPDEQEDYLRFRKVPVYLFQNDYVQLMQSVPLARKLLDADLAIQCVQTARRIVAMFEQVAPVLQAEARWQYPPAFERLRTLRALAIEHAARFVLKEDERDKQAVSDLVDAGNQLARKLRVREMFDARQVIEEQRRWVQQIKGNAPPPRNNQ
jgi:hypothetical protein